MELGYQTHGARVPGPWSSGTKPMGLRYQARGAWIPNPWSSGTKLVELRYQIHRAQVPNPWSSSTKPMDLRYQTCGAQVPSPRSSGTKPMDLRYQAHGARVPNPWSSGTKPMELGAARQHVPGQARGLHQDVTPAEGSGSPAWIPQAEAGNQPGCAVPCQLPLPALPSPARASSSSALAPGVRPGPR